MQIVRQIATNIVKMAGGRYLWGTDRLCTINEDGTFNTIFLDTAPLESELITIADNDLPGDFENWKYIFTTENGFEINPLWGT
jgi:hypothetical protein